MLEALKNWARNPETWFNIFLATFILWLLGKFFAFARKRVLVLTKKMSEASKVRISAFAEDDALTFKVIASREAWLVIFVLGSLSWFAFVVLSPLRVLLDLGTPVFLLSISPVWVLEILFLSRDSLARDVLKERKRIKPNQPAQPIPGT